MSNYSNGSSCNPLVNDSTQNDGGVPIVLGVNVALGGGIFVVFLVIHFCCKDFTMAGVLRKKRGKYLLESEGINDAENDYVTMQRKRLSSLNVTKDICESLMKFVTMGEKGIRSRIGVQGSIYLTLQLYFLAILAVYTLFSLVVILPINYSGGLQQDVPFARTTLANLKASSPLMWTHVIFSVVYFIIAGVFFLHFLLKHEDIPTNTQTVMVTRVPKYIHVEDLLQHFEEVFPGSQISDIKFAYNTQSLQKQWKKFKKVSKQLKASQAYEIEHTVPLMVRTEFFSEEKVSAIEYYESRLSVLRPGLSLERNNALNSKLPTVFISFNKEESATEVVDAYRMCRCGPSSNLTESINSRFWDVSVAPLPSDIIWNNLSLSGILWWLRWILINTVLTVFLIFFTTPAVLLNSVPQLQLIGLGLENITAQIDSSFKTPHFLRSYWSSLLLILFGFLLLFLVTKSVYLESHWSRTQRELLVLRKAYTFKVLQVIVLPSIGLTSLSALGYLIQYEHEQTKEFTKQLSCIFLPNNGAFFISYIVIATFVSTPIELIRIPQLLQYMYGKITARSKYDRRETMKKILKSNYALGIQYAYCLLVFSLTVTFSISVPLIMPFGLTFFIIKYFVDKYNLLYAYRPLPSDNSVHIHKTAIKIALIGVSFLQLSTFSYSVVRTVSINNPVAITMLVCLLLSIIIMCGVFVYGWFSYLIPSLRRRLGYKSVETDNEKNITIKPGSYIAPVLSETADQITVDAASLTAMTYESFGRTIAGGEVKINANPTST